MSAFHAQQARKSAATAYREASEYASKADMRLSRDAVAGYWLHYDGRQRFERFLSDVRGTVDHLNLYGVQP